MRAFKIRTPSLVHSVLVASCALSSSALATTVLTYVQNFDGLPTSNTSITGTGTINLQAAVSQLAGTGVTWQAARIAGTNTTAVPFNVGNGSGNTGGLYSYAETGSSDRWLGLFASGTTTPAAGLALVNTTTFAYGFSSDPAITSSNFLSSTAMIPNPAGLAIDDLTITGSADGDGDGDNIPDSIDNCPARYTPRNWTATVTAWVTRACWRRSATTSTPTACPTRASTPSATWT